MCAQKILHGEILPTWGQERAHSKIVLVRTSMLYYIVHTQLWLHNFFYLCPQCFSVFVLLFICTMLLAPLPTAFPLELKLIFDYLVVIRRTKNICILQHEQILKIFDKIQGKTYLFFTCTYYNIVLLFWLCNFRTWRTDAEQKNQSLFSFVLSNIISFLWHRWWFTSGKLNKKDCNAHAE